MKKLPSKQVVKTKPKVNGKVPAKIVQKAAAFSPLEILAPMGATALSQIVLHRPKKHWGEYIVSGRTGMINAPRGSGKSTYILALSLSMAYEAVFLDNKPTKPRNVVILDGEMDLHTMQGRLKEQAQALSVNIDDTHLKFVSPELFDGIMPNLSTVNGQREIDKAIGDQWDVLFIDNYSAFSESGREDGESWMPWIRWMLKHKRAGRTVIVIHHTGKNGQQRGSSKHEDALDFSIALKPVPDDKQDGSLRFIFEWKKSRHLPSDKTRPFLVTYAKAKDGYIWSRGQVEDANEKMVEAKRLRQEGMSQVDIAAKLDVNKSTVSRWLKKNSN
ncbi:MAG: AAA family ATPase [Pseudomonadota bacterium]